VGMKDSEKEFTSFLRGRGLEVSNLGVAAAIDVWIAFYKAQRFEDVDDGFDWLWFQYGTYDWGGGHSFELDLTRQFIVHQASGEDAIWQLHLVLHFPPGSAPGRGIETCEDPASADKFRDTVMHSEPVKRVVTLRPERLELYLTDAE
jgi:hypothetical protein